MEQQKSKNSQQAEGGVVLNCKELELLIGLLNSRNAAGAAIKDLRLIQSTVQMMKSKLPAKPIRPEIGPMEEGATEYKKEVVEEYQKAHEEWAKELEVFLNHEQHCDFSSYGMLIMKQRLQGFASFNTDEQSRETVLKLAEKFGL